MSGKFNPKFSITSSIANNLMKMEAAKQKIKDLPITPSLLKKLRETARLNSIHYSTQIEGNRLTRKEVEDILKGRKSFPQKKRDEKEIKGYHAVLGFMEEYVKKGGKVTEEVIKTLHALVMGEGREKVKTTAYRDGQNVIREGLYGAIVYMPPEAKDVPELMEQLVHWILEDKDLPCPLIAGIAHYQFVTIHPYYDGNGRTARLLATLILHLCGYDLKGIYSLEDYYAKNLSDYYDAVSVGTSHNYYVGRAEADITKWVEYFCDGMAKALEAVKKRAEEESKKGTSDKSEILKKLDPKKRRALEFFVDHDVITSKQIGELFSFKSRTSRNVCQKWFDQGFIIIVDPSKKGRKYKLAPDFLKLLKK